MLGEAALIKITAGCAIIREYQLWRTILFETIFHRFNYFTFTILSLVVELYIPSPSPPPPDNRFSILFLTENDGELIGRDPDSISNSLC